MDTSTKGKSTYVYFCICVLVCVCLFACSFVCSMHVCVYVHAMVHTLGLFHWAGTILQFDCCIRVFTALLEYINDLFLLEGPCMYACMHACVTVGILRIH